MSEKLKPGATTEFQLKKVLTPITQLKISHTNIPFSSKNGFSYLEMVLIALVCIALAYNFLVFWESDIDDSYITFRFARNLANGIGPVFNQGERVEGYSNPLFMAMLSLGMVLGIGPEFLAKFLVGCSALLLCWAVYKVAVNRLIVSRTWAVWAVLVLVFNPSFRIYSLVGMETIVFGCGLSWLIYFSANPNWCVLAPISIAVALLRPEGIFYSVGILLVTVPLHLKDKPKIFNLIKTTVIVVLVFSAILIARYLYYNDLFPNTYYAKLGDRKSLEIYRGITYLKNYINGYFGYLFFLFLTLAYVFLGIIKERNSILYTIFMAFLFNIVYTVWVGGDWMPFYRFMVPSLLFTALLPVYVTKNVSMILPGDQETLVSTPTIKRIATPKNLFSAVLLSFIVIAEFLSYPEVRNIRPWRGDETNARVRIARFLSQKVDSGEWVACPDMGVIPYFCNQIKFVDILGLTDGFIAKSEGGYLNEPLPGLKPRVSGLLACLRMPKIRSAPASWDFERMPFIPRFKTLGFSGIFYKASNKVVDYIYRKGPKAMVLVGSSSTPDQPRFWKGVETLLVCDPRFKNYRHVLSEAERPTYVFHVFLRQ